MKVLTILIFSGDDRLDVKYLLKDLASLNQSNTDIRVVEGRASQAATESV